VMRVQSEDWTIMLKHGDSIGGNSLHMAPEVLAAAGRLSHAGASEIVDYSKQPTFEAACIMFFIAFGTHPMPGYPSDFAMVPVRREDLAACGYPAGFVPLLQSMLHRDPALRPTIPHCKQALNDMDDATRLPAENARLQVGVVRLIALLSPLFARSTVVMVHIGIAVLCCAVLCCAVLCCAVLCCAVLCCAVLCCAVDTS
jgi:hypothetical protein